jgi:AraC family transcriptional regulator of adaptative response / DNA-3-methyladenine glycosylase II
MPRARAETVIRANELLADGSVVIDAGSDRNETERRLCAVRGVGPWTAGYVRMRALGDPDVMLPSDTGVRNALVSLGESGERAHIDHAARAWSPWRSYALHHLWHSLDASTTRHSTNETY